MKPRHAAVFALAILFGACASAQSTMDRWMGRPESQVLGSWGVPDKTTPLPDGTRMDTWTTYWNDDSSSWGAEDLHVCRKTIIVNTSGTVVNGAVSDCGYY